VFERSEFKFNHPVNLFQDGTIQPVRTPIRDKDFKGFLDGKKTSIMAHVIYFLSLCKLDNHCESQMS